MADYQPAQGDPGTVIERTVEYLAPFDSAWLSRCRPAPPAVIDEYARQAGFGSSENSLPASFLAFVRCAGLSSGGLLEPFDIYSGIDIVVEFYQGRESSRLRKCGHPFSVALFTSMMQPFAFDRRTEALEPQIVELEGLDIVRLVAHSWESFVMKAAMLQVEMRRLQCGRWCTSTENSTSLALRAHDWQTVADAFDAIATRHGLASAWPSDDGYRISVSERFSIFAEVDPLGALRLRSFAADESTLRRISSEFERELGAFGGGPLRVSEGKLCC